jgi:hypothetical protein
MNEEYSSILNNNKQWTYVGIVGDKGDMRSRKSGGIFAGLANVFADVLVVTHQNFDTGLIGFLLHLFQFTDSGGTGLFKVDAFAAVSDTFGQKLWVVAGTATDQGKSRGIRGRKGFERIGKLDSMFRFSFVLELLEFLSSGRVTSCSQEPGFDNVIQRSAGAPVVGFGDGINRGKMAIISVIVRKKYYLKDESALSAVSEAGQTGEP